MNEYKQDNLTIYNADCMEIMSRYEDNYFDLAVVDPPYGIDHANKAGKQAGQKYGNACAPKANYAEKDWDIYEPDKNYFNELKRVSKNQIIWGANYYPQHLFKSMGWIVWDKDNGDNGFSDCELAFTSFQKALRKFKYTWNGMIQGDMKNKESRIHPTQKPVKLYNWIYKNYAQEGQKILDTHLGSGSNAISAHYAKMGEFVGCELDKDYYEASIKRIHQETRQLELF